MTCEFGAILRGINRARLEGNAAQRPQASGVD
jgi:hypothetical protein